MTDLTPATLRNAEACLDFIAAQFSPLAALQNEIKKLGGLEDAIAVAVARLDDLKRRELEAQEIHTQNLLAAQAEARASAQQIKDEAEAFAAKRRGEADAALSDARAEGERIKGEAGTHADANREAGQRALQGAKTEAASILQAAGTDADRIKSEAEAATKGHRDAVARAKTALAELETKIERRSAELTALHESFAAKETEHNRIRDVIAGLKGDVKAHLGL